MVSEQYNVLKKIQTLKKGKYSDVYLLDDGRIFKQFHRIEFDLCRQSDLNLEQKILKTDKIRKTPEINLPLTAVYDGSVFVGYTCKKEPGVTYSTFVSNLNREQLVDLNMYAYLYNKLETAVVKGWHRDMCFPDLIGPNFLIDKDLNVSLIDFDGIQYGNYVSSSISSAIVGGDIYSSKYRNGKLWTKELDKKSLMYMYFWMIFKINLRNVGIPSFSGTIMSLADFFEGIGLEEPEIYEKVRCTISFCEKGALLGEDVWYIAENYDLKIVEDEEMYCGFARKLVKKKK